MPEESHPLVQLPGSEQLAEQHGADVEVALDIDVIGAAAPGAAQVVYFAPNSDSGFIDAISEAAQATPAPSPPSDKMAGWMPRDISRSYSSTSARPSATRDSSRPNSGWADGTARCAARRPSPSDTSRCFRHLVHGRLVLRPVEYGGHVHALALGGLDRRQDRQVGVGRRAGGPQRPVLDQFPHRVDQVIHDHAVGHGDIGDGQRPAGDLKPQGGQPPAGLGEPARHVHPAVPAHGAALSPAQRLVDAALRGVQADLRLRAGPQAQRRGRGALDRQPVGDPRPW